MPIVTVEKPLKDKLGDDGVQSLINLLNQTKTDQKQDILEYVEEKFERRLTEEIGKVNERITEEIGKVNERITEEIGKVNMTMTAMEKRIDTKIERIRADLIKWMFIFWVGQLAAILGMLVVFFK